MTTSPVFRAYFNRSKASDRGLRRILIIELGVEETEKLDVALGPRAHRSQNIPITFVIGEAAEALVQNGPEVVPEKGGAPVAEAAPARPSDQKVEPDVSPSAAYTNFLLMRLLEEQQKANRLLEGFREDAAGLCPAVEAIRDRLGELASLSQGGARRFGL